ncbi:YfhO family protein [Rhodococcus kroppenstedtii]|uniref:Uncharacterized protein n=1 Tax=Rhodococcoides kroppenstedtii TaxID=293050 RepID=A0A1I0TJJ3_9NOCA|nr:MULTISPECIES: YfhO family protein [Rhodococcus]MBT1191011.1 hypothetical protein [Rhodococcus kroppenstedtii]MBY6314150.1 hypothetical protein [Rhodococcus kroppenstedtii]MBY6321923.1 hypothetical protein [Rhodococcus kroppenstedtii]MBY6400469.1 hypothetical protein [Rhodococcus kroppenstedtii]MBY6437440.1 hypothetical protein [Rhodococcus kroppenstedtii]
MTANTGSTERTNPDRANLLHTDRMHTVPCRSGRRELWLLLVIVVTGVLMAAVVFLPAVLG